DLMGLVDQGLKAFGDFQIHEFLLSVSLSLMHVRRHGARPLNADPDTSARRGAPSRSRDRPATGPPGCQPAWLCRCTADEPDRLPDGTADPARRGWRPAR